MNDRITITGRTGSLNRTLPQIRSPRALLVLILEALRVEASHADLIHLIESQSKRLGLELGVYFAPSAGLARKHTSTLLCKKFSTWTEEKS